MLRSFSLQERSWIFYDWANSAYSIIIGASILPIFFKSLTKTAGLSANMADSYWGYATSIATLILALLAPLLGTLGDFKDVKMRFFKFFFAMGVLAAAALAVSDQWLVILIIYIITTWGFSGANLFYDAFLVDVTTEDRMDRVSTYGFGMGYIGGSTIPFVISIGLILFGSNIGITPLIATKMSFILTAIWWFVFSIPFLKNVKQVNYINGEAFSVFNSFRRLFTTFKNISKYKFIFVFLIAYFFYIDGVNTIISMATVYGDSIGVSSTFLMLALLMTQVVAFPFALIYGRLAQKFGSHVMILAGIIMYFVICILGYRMANTLDFFIVAFLVATSQGGIQALSRSFYGKMVPKESSNEFFGFYDVFGKFAAILGPALFAFTSQISQNSRIGVLSVIILFIIGGAVFTYLVLNEKKLKKGTELEVRG